MIATIYWIIAALAFVPCFRMTVRHLRREVVGSLPADGFDVGMSIVLGLLLGACFSLVWPATLLGAGIFSACRSLSLDNDSFLLALGGSTADEKMKAREKAVAQREREIARLEREALR